jgi:hypothetical protein
MDTIADFVSKNKINKDEIIKKQAEQISTLKEKVDEVRTKYRKAYSSNLSARSHIENIKRHKQTVLKAVITLIEDGLLVMSDKDLQERFFVDIGNIKGTRTLIRRARKESGKQ